MCKLSQLWLGRYRQGGSSRKRLSQSGGNGKWNRRNSSSSKLLFQKASLIPCIKQHTASFTHDPLPHFICLHSTDHHLRGDTFWSLCAVCHSPWEEGLHWKSVLFTATSLKSRIVSGIFIKETISKCLLSKCIQLFCRNI